MELRVLLPIRNTSQLVNNSSKCVTTGEQFHKMLDSNKNQGLGFRTTLFHSLSSFSSRDNKAIRKSQPNLRVKTRPRTLKSNMTYVAPKKPHHGKPSLNTATSPLKKNHKTIKYYSGRWMKCHQVIFGHRQLEMMLDISADHKTTTHKTRGNTQVFTHG